MVVLLSPPRRGAQDRAEQAGDLGRVGLAGPSAPPVARLVAEPVGALAAGGCAVQASTPGDRPSQLPAAHGAARHDVTKHARCVTRRRIHAIAWSVCGTERAAIRTAIA